MKYIILFFLFFGIFDAKSQMTYYPVVDMPDSAYIYKIVINDTSALKYSHKWHDKTDSNTIWEKVRLGKVKADTIWNSDYNCLTPKTKRELIIMIDAMIHYY